VQSSLILNHPDPIMVKRMEQCQYDQTERGEWNLYKSPTLRNILVGVFIFLVIVLIFSSMDNLVKTLGRVLMIVPSQMGFYPLSSADEVVPIDLKSNPTDLTFIHAGPYQVFADDYDLLSITIQVEQANSSPWLVVRSKTSGVTIPVNFVHRGLRLYDTPYAAGRPIFTLDIPSPGVYQLSHPTKPASIYFVPDLTSSYASTISYSFLVEIALLAGLLLAFYQSRRKTQNARIREIETRTRERAEQFWKTRKR
jgi:disulfide bond formation protein DsbB